MKIRRWAEKRGDSNGSLHPHQKLAGKLPTLDKNVKHWVILKPFAQILSSKRHTKR
jgi:hypothetical protein